MQTSFSLYYHFEICLVFFFVKCYCCERSQNNRRAIDKFKFLQMSCVQKAIICAFVGGFLFYFTVFTHWWGSAILSILSYFSPYLHIHHTHSYIFYNNLYSLRIWHTLFPFSLCLFLHPNFLDYHLVIIFSLNVFIHFSVIFSVMSITPKFLPIRSFLTLSDLVAPHVCLFFLVSTTSIT